MRKLITSGLAALVAAASLGATASPAAAEPWGGGWGGGWGGDDGGWGGDDAGWGLLAGVAALGITAAIANSNDNAPYYGPQYGGPGYGPAPRTCVGAQRVWSPYDDAYVIRRFQYAC